MPSYTRIKSLSDCTTKHVLVTAVVNYKPVQITMLACSTSLEHMLKHNVLPVSLHEVRD